jgi:hypothetical protein
VDIVQAGTALLEKSRREEHAKREDGNAIMEDVTVILRSNPLPPWGWRRHPTGSSGRRYNWKSRSDWSVCKKRETGLLEISAAA